MVTADLVEMRDLIHSEAAGVFASLRDPAVFSNVSGDEGYVMWANGLDIAPDASYDDIKRHGIQVLR